MKRTIGSVVMAAVLAAAAAEASDMKGDKFVTAPIEVKIAYAKGAFDLMQSSGMLCPRPISVGEVISTTDALVYRHQDKASTALAADFVLAAAISLGCRTPAAEGAGEPKPTKKESL